MNLEEFKKILVSTYEQTTKDNMEDKIEMLTKIATLCQYLILKGLLTTEEMKEILNAGTEVENNERD